MDYSLDRYGLLVRTLGSGSLMSIINTLRYISRSRRANAPRFFKEAFVGVTGIYLLSHIVGLLDLWLHSGARSITVTRSIPVTTDARYGITYNPVSCGPLSKTEVPCQSFVYTSEGFLNWGFQQWMHFQAYDTILDVNPYMSLEYINGTAILVPGPSKGFSSRGFTFNTLGLRAKCENLRDRCDTLTAPPVQFLVPGGSPVTNCSKAGYPRIPYHTSGDLLDSGRDARNIESLVIGVIGDEIGGMINGTGDFSSLGWTSNPASAVVQLRWPNVTAPRTPDAPGVAYSNAVDLYASCSLEYLDVVASYDAVEAEWSILETNLTSSELASVFWSPVLFQMITSNLLHALRPYMTNRGSQAMEVLEMTLANSNMGYITPLVTSVSASNVTTPQLVALGLYPAAPTILLIGCLYLYSLVALFIFFLACTSNNKVIFVPRELTKKGEKDEERSALDVAQTWLTDPLPFIGSLFPGGDGRHVARSAESDPLLQVYDSDWELGKVGMGLYTGSKGEMIYGLMRQSHSRSRRYGRLFPVVDEESALQEKVPIHGSTVIIPSLAVMGKAES
ncbi:hypothetical protein FRC04_001547 [Tulasnella sp. 424]|nr:hypothetical protein FRC04_001547 [Tulasnella sp. 424]KAG8969090.1 hypothetical protein FRC05_001243 [Tulasnella sp. 425]